MKGFRRTITIPRPPEEVFAYATAAEHIGEWLGEVVSIEALQPGPVRVGARYSQTRRVHGKEATTTVEIVKHRGPGQGPPPWEHAARAELMGVSGEYHYTFSPAGDGTKIDLEARIEAKSLLARALVGVAATEMEREDGDQLERLARALASAGT